MSQNIIKLNIGGVHHDTTIDTLTQSFTADESNYFEILLNSQVPTSKDDQGRYFIDRDGNLFRYILQFLRTSQVHVNEIQLIEELLIEADFYQLTSLTRFLEERKKTLQTQKLHVFKIGFVETQFGWSAKYRAYQGSNLTYLYDKNELPDDLDNYFSYQDVHEDAVIMMLLRHGYHIVRKYESDCDFPPDNSYRNDSNYHLKSQRIIRYYIFSNNTSMSSGEQ